MTTPKAINAENVHIKKCEMWFFNLILEGKKWYEIRKEDDCTYNENDILILRGIEGGMYTGDVLIFRIVNVLRDPLYVKEGYAVLSLGEI